MFPQGANVTDINNFPLTSSLQNTETRYFVLCKNVKLASFQENMLIRKTVFPSLCRSLWEDKLLYTLVPAARLFSRAACLAISHCTGVFKSCSRSRVVTWYMGSGLKAQNMAGIRAQRKGLRAQMNGIRDHKAFEPKSGIRFITRSKTLLSQYFSA